MGRHTCMFFVRGYYQPSCEWCANRTESSHRGYLSDILPRAHPTARLLLRFTS